MPTLQWLIRDRIRFPVLAAHIWFSETGTPWNGKGKSPLLGFHSERAYVLLYNGILGDKTPKGGNVLTRETLTIIHDKIVKKQPTFKGALTIYGETQCAIALESLSEVEFWLRNVAQHKNSFRLPLASGNFYPDFVAKLKDGRIFVVEYKGEHLAGSGNDDTNEKRVVGALWEKASGGRGLFAMIEREVAGRDMRGQLLDAINRRP
jgi:hypothetical protein